MATAQEVIELIDSLWTRNGSDRISDEDLRTVGYKIVELSGANEVTSLGIEWSAAVTYQTDDLATINNRIWKSKTDNNLNNQPPTDPNTTENTYWVEQSKSDSTPIREWTAGVYGSGLIIVFWNDKLYKLNNPVRPFNSVNIDNEIIAGDWVLIIGSSSGSGSADDGGTFNGVISLDNPLGTLYDTYDLAVNGDPAFSIDSGEVLNGLASVIILADGIQTIDFSIFNGITLGVPNDDTLPSGTYSLFFWKDKRGYNISIPENVTGTGSVLSAPANFSAIAINDNQINLSWSPITSATSYSIDRSTSSNFDTFTTIYTGAGLQIGSLLYFYDTGRTASTLYYYRINATDGTNTSDYALSNATTQANDTTAPSVLFVPQNGTSDFSVEGEILIYFNEPIKHIDGSTIDNTTVDSLCTFKLTDSGGADVGFDATINANKDIITLTPSNPLDFSQLYYIAVNNFEDAIGNEQTTAQSSTFTTEAFSIDAVANLVGWISFADNSLVTVDENTKVSSVIDAKFPTVTWDELNDNQGPLYSDANNKVIFTQTDVLLRSDGNIAMSELTGFSIFIIATPPLNRETLLGGSNDGSVGTLQFSNADGGVRLNLPSGIAVVPLTYTTTKTIFSIIHNGPANTIDGFKNDSTTASTFNITGTKGAVNIDRIGASSGSLNGYDGDVYQVYIVSRPVAEAERLQIVNALNSIEPTF